MPDEYANAQNAQEDTSEPSIKFWISQIDAAKKAAKTYLENSRNAWEEYLGTRQNPSSYKIKIGVPVDDARYPIFWSSVRTIQPALYSATPIIAVEKMFADLPDPVARDGCIFLERLSNYLMRCFPLDRVMYSTRDDFIITGKNTPRVCFESEISKYSDKQYYTLTEAQDSNGNVVQTWVNSEGEILEDPSTLKQDDTGSYTEEIEENLEKVYSKLLPVRYDDLLHTPNARHWEEIDWIAYKCMMLKADVRERFGSEIANEIPYTSQSANAGTEEKETLPSRYAHIWELWDKRSKKVFWIAEGYNAKFLDTKEDPYELPGFFPSPPFVLGTVGPDNLYAVPDFVQLRPLIDQLHGMSRRLRVLVRAARRRFVYDASITELEDVASSSSEAEGIGISMFQQQIVDKGGIDKVVQWFPLQDVVEAIQQMSQVMQQYADTFNEMWGIPDILRGATDPSETAAAQQLKGKYVSLRFSTVQREFQRMVRDSIEMVCDLALSKFPEEKLKEVMGIRFESEEVQARWPQTLLMLRNKEERKVRLSIQTDSTISMNDDIKAQQRSELAKTLFDGIQAVANVQQVSPSMTAVAAQTLEYVVRGLKDGKEVEDRLSAAIDQMLQPQQPPPPPPDYQAAALQIEQQKVTSQSMANNADAQLKAQQQQIDYVLESNKAMNDIRVKMSELQLRAQELQIEAQKVGVMSERVNVEGQKVGAEAEHRNARLNFEASAQQFDQNMQALLFQLERQRMQLDEQEKYMTEIRLQREQSLAEQKAVLGLEDRQQQMPVQPVTIINAPRQESPTPLPTTSLLGIPFTRARETNPFGGSGL